MQEDGLSFTDVADSVSEEVRNSMSSGPMAGYRNIAVLGVDSITGSLDEGNNRSDVMIIASVNEKTGDIKLMSVYRDTYLDVGDGTYAKANAAYAYGGPTQTVEMLNKNLDLNISDYAVVGFEGIAKIVDAVGGVEIDVQQDEIEHLNNYQLTMSQETGMEDIPVTQPGLQTLNGLQATAYCRIRYTEGNDFKRTERQREVLTKVFEKIKKNPLKAVASATALMSYVKTSMNMGELFTLGVQAFRFNISESTGFPNENLRTVGYIGDQSCVIPVTLAKNVTWLHEELFGDTGYTPSQTVQDISAHVSQVSGYY
jgi:LCP family protein required for cell wall assembly